MARFHVHRLKTGDGLVMDLQADFLDNLETRVVAPVLPLERMWRPFVRLSPVLDIDGRTYVVVIPSLASVPRQMIGDPVADFSVLRDELIAATDFLFQGF